MSIIILFQSNRGKYSFILISFAENFCKLIVFFLKENGLYSTILSEIKCFRDIKLN